MKGIIIFEDSNPTLKNVYCINLTNSDIRLDICTEATYTLTGIRSNMKSATCDKSDTYDFEIGALIAIMKMCGRDKVIKACDELYRDDNYKNALQEMTENNEKLIEENETLKKEKEQIIVAKNVLYNKLEEENEKLKNESMHRLRDKLNLKKEYVALKEENTELHKNIDELFESDKYWKSEAGRLSFEKHRLEENITDMIFCGGRQNGKQYTFLVELFKKLDQKKVDAAYKEAYNTTLPEESKEKTELPRTLDINGTIYRKSIQIKDFGEQINKLTVDSLIEENRAFMRKCVDEWIKPLTKREEMWENIKNGKIDSVKVEKAFINNFLSEAEENGLVWANYPYEKPTEWNRWKDWRTHNHIVFTIWNYPPQKELTWGIKPKENTVDYLPPMRWDLFKKGRIAVKITHNNHKEFYEACEKELGKKPSTYPMLWDGVTISICKKDGLFEIFTIEDQNKTGRKIVDWEDVR